MTEDNKDLHSVKNLKGVGIRTSNLVTQLMKKTMWKINSGIQNIRKQMTKCKRDYLKNTFLNCIFDMVMVLKYDEAFAMYIPALIPFPDTSANVKKYSSGVALTTSK